LIVLSSVVGILLVIGIVGLIVRRPDRQQGGSRRFYSGSRPYVNVPDVMSPKVKPVSTPRSPRTCPSCGATIRFSGADFCQNCGIKLRTGLQTAQPPARGVPQGACIVCGLLLQGSGDIVTCPYCGGVAHRAHMLEWLHVKDYCPMCRRHLEVQDLQEQLVD
jgi:hypothetical protein